MISFHAPDLSQHPPRSPRSRLGGFVHLPRLLDKARAFASGKLGEYIFPCPQDKRFFDFTGINTDSLLAEAKTGKSDTEMLAWVMANLKTPKAPWEIEAWSRFMESNAPGDAQRHASFAEAIKTMAPGREDIKTTFDRLDMDDYVSFGGKA